MNLIKVYPESVLNLKRWNKDNSILPVYKEGSLEDFIDEYIKILPDLEKNKRGAGYTTLKSLKILSKYRDIEKIPYSKYMGGNGAAIRTSYIGSNSSTGSAAVGNREIEAEIEEGVNSIHHSNHPEIQQKIATPSRCTCTVCTITATNPHSNRFQKGNKGITTYRVSGTANGVRCECTGSEDRTTSVHSRKSE